MYNKKSCVSNLLEPTSTSSNKSRSAWIEAIQAFSSQEWISVWQCIATLFKYSRPSDQKRWPKKIKLLVGRTILTYHQATQRHALERAARSHAAWSTPTRGIVLNLLPFLPSLIDASSGVRVYGGDMTCSSLPIWSYIAQMSFSPQNTKSGPGLQHCHAKLECRHQYARPLSSHLPAVWTYLWRASLWVQQENTSQVPSPQVGSVRVAIVVKIAPHGSHLLAVEGGKYYSITILALPEPVGFSLMAVTWLTWSPRHWLWFQEYAWVTLFIDIHAMLSQLIRMNGSMVSY